MHDGRRNGKGDGELSCQHVLRVLVAKLGRQGIGLNVHPGNLFGFERPLGHDLSQCIKGSVVVTAAGMPLEIIASNLVPCAKVLHHGFCAEGVGDDAAEYSS